MHFIRVILLLSFIGLYSGNAANPDLRCISVNDNGTVTLIFTSTDSLNIYRNNTGVFLKIDSTSTITDTSYTDSKINAYTTSTVFYYLQNKTNLSQLSDTLQVIELNISNAIQGFADLTWNTNHNPLLSTSSTNYQIERVYSNGAWKTHDSVTFSGYQDTYVDTIDICTTDSIFYRISIKDALGCYSMSSVKGNIFQDKTKPSLVMIDSVSVDSNGNVLIGWQPNLNDDTYGYIIYENKGFFSVPKDTIFNKTASNYVYTGLNTSANSEIYQLAAIDSCGNVTAISDPVHNTICLKYRLDRCLKEVNISWNRYNGWDNISNLQKYELFYSSNSSGFKLLKNFTDITSDSLESVFTDFNDGDSLCFYVRAYSNNSYSSSSNRGCFVVDIINAPDSTYLRQATVLDQNSINLTWLVDQTADIMFYYLLRGTSPTSFDTIAKIKPKKQNTMSFIDEDTFTDEKSYYYKLLVIDSCGYTAFTSNIGRSVFLQMVANLDETTTPDIFNQNLLYESINKLSWNDYEGWMGGVDYYNIYRSIDDGAFELAKTVYFGESEYEEEISEHYDSKGKFCYYLNAIENGAANIYGLQDTVRSNAICVFQIPRLFMPNAFNPTGTTNRIFKPVTIFEERSNYLFQIYDRWGNLMFESTNPDDGWDGAFKGRILSAGAYVYYLNFTGTNGQVVGMKGQVYLVR